jgi:membrane protease YdiL (CAAX protease family)
MPRFTLDQSRDSVIQAAVALIAYLLILQAAAATLGGGPGTWTFAVAQLFGLPVALGAVRFGGALSLHSRLPTVTETTASAGGALLAMAALVGTHPAVTGGLKALPAALIAAVVIAVTEELLFRATLVPVLARRFGVFAAITVSAALFGALHYQSGQAAAVAAFFAGLALGGLYVRSGVGACIAFHAVFNVIAGPFFGLSLGGLPWPGLLEPAVTRDPLTALPVQLVLLGLAIWWAPFGIRPGDRLES